MSLDERSGTPLNWLWNVSEADSGGRPRMLMKGKVALVTGASRGIGAATARTLARHGAAVAVNYFQSEDAARRLVSEILAEGGTAVAVKADVRDGIQADAMARKA